MSQVVETKKIENFNWKVLKLTYLTNKSHLSDNMPVKGMFESRPSDNISLQLVAFCFVALIYVT